MNSSPKRSAEVYTATFPLMSLLAAGMAWVLVIVVWCGRALMHGEWPGPLKLWLCTVLGALATVNFVVRVRSRFRIRSSTSGRPMVLDGLQVLWIVLLVVGGGAFLAWVIWGPPHPGP